MPEESKEEMETFLAALKENFSLLALLVSIPAGQGIYNLYRSYKLSRYQQDEKQDKMKRSKWFLRIGKIILLIAFFFLIILYGVGLLLHVKIQNMIAFIIGSILLSPIYAIAQIFFRKSE